MEEKENSYQAPFPQADDFNKIIALINIDEEIKMKDKVYVSQILSFVSDRQVSYYTSACIYLGILNSDKTFSTIGKALREKNIVDQEIALCMLLMKNSIFAEIYFTEKVLELELEREEIIDIMKKYGVSFESEALYERRSQTVRCWVNWVKEKTNL